MRSTCIIKIIVLFTAGLLITGFKFDDDKLNIYDLSEFDIHKPISISGFDNYVYIASDHDKYIYKFTKNIQKPITKYNIKQNINDITFNNMGELIIVGDNSFKIINIKYLKTLKKIKLNFNLQQIKFNNITQEFIGFATNYKINNKNTTKDDFKKVILFKIDNFKITKFNTISNKLSKDYNKFFTKFNYSYVSTVGYKKYIKYLKIVGLTPNEDPFREAITDSYENNEYIYLINYKNNLLYIYKK